MKLRVKYRSKLVRKGYGAWVLYPWMFFRDRRRDVTDRLFRHELEHVYQVQRMGWLRFYVTYLWHLARKGYNDHPYEIEARAMESLPLTAAERELKNA